MGRISGEISYAVKCVFAGELLHLFQGDQAQEVTSIARFPLEIERLTTGDVEPVVIFRIEIQAGDMGPELRE